MRLHPDIEARFLKMLGDLGQERAAKKCQIGRRTINRFLEGKPLSNGSVALIVYGVSRHERESDARPVPSGTPGEVAAAN